MLLNIVRFTSKFHFLLTLAIKLKFQSQARAGGAGLQQGLLICPTTGIYKQHPHQGLHHGCSLTPHTSLPKGPVWGIPRSLVAVRRGGPL